MKRVAARIAATAVLALTASILLGIVNVSADQKPGNPGHHYGEISNPGHHYGQLKHMAAPPPSNQTAPAVSGPNGSTHAPGRGGAVGPALSTPDAVIDAPAALPSRNVQPALNAKSAAVANHDALSWLILLILPALLAVWVLVFARALLTAARLRKPAV